jgi:hypothetical protein
MTTLGDIATKVRSKNAGPFWLTVDIFCGTERAFQEISEGLQTSEVARIFQIEPKNLKRFDIPDLAVIKLSMPRPQVQGTAADRDMHGASFASLLVEMPI